MAGEHLDCYLAVPGVRALAARVSPMEREAYGPRTRCTVLSPTPRGEFQPHSPATSYDQRDPYESRYRAGETTALPRARRLRHKISLVSHGRGDSNPQRPVLETGALIQLSYIRVATLPRIPR